MDKPSKGKFVRVSCARCGHSQVIYGKAASQVRCLKCNKLLVRISGGKTQIRTIVREVFK